MTTAARKTTKAPKTETYAYGIDFRVTVTAAGQVVTASDCPAFPVGAKLAEGQLRACGWRKVADKG